jgi:hypothetical protein
MPMPASVLATGIPKPRIDPKLLKTIANALAVVREANGKNGRIVALAELGDIDLPNTAPTAEDAQRLQTIGPLYLGFELDQAGLLRTAELVAGLFASGAITQPLGPTSGLIAQFWHTRQQRMNEAEREQILAQAFNPHDFYPMMQGLCNAMVHLSSYPVQTIDFHGQAVLQQAAQELGAWLAARGGGMISYAADEILQTLSQALRFLRDRLLQTAFGVHDLWSLADVVGQAQGQAGQTGRHRADLGRAGATVLGWLSAGAGDRFALDPAGADGQRVMAAAEDWLLAYQALGATVSSDAGLMPQTTPQPTPNYAASWQPS